jgi:hypothetical protein
MIFPKIAIIYFNSISPREGVVRIDYYDGRYVCEKISIWLMKKFTTPIPVMQPSSTESHPLKRKISPFTQYI